MRRFLPDPRFLALAALSAAVALPPLLFYPRGEHLFWTSESASVRLLAPLAFALALWAARGESPFGERRLRPMLWAWAGLWLWMAVSGAASLRKDLALRQMLELSCYPLAFAAAWRLGGEARARHRLAALALGAGALMAVYGVAQSSGWDFMPWNNTFNGRGSSTLGNPNFFGGHMALLLPLALAFALEARWRPARWVAGGVALLLALGLLSSGTRGAMLGAAVGVGAVLALSRGAVANVWRYGRMAIVASLAALLLAAALVTGMTLKPGLRDAVGRIPGGERVVAAAYVASANAQRAWLAVRGMDESAQQRLMLLRSSLAMAAEHPVLGVGVGNFRIYFPSVQHKVVDPKALDAVPYFQSEHAHNDWVQMAAEAGFAAALLLLAVSALFYLALARRLPAPGAPGRGLAVGVLGGALALQAHGLLNFPFLIFPTQMTLWVLAALALREVLAERPAEAPLPQPASAVVPASASTIAPPAADTASVPPAPVAAAPEAPRPSRLRPLVLVLAAAFVLAGGGWALWSVPQDRFWWEARGEARYGNLQNAHTRFNKVLAMDPWEDRIYFERAMINAQQYLTLQAVADWNQVLKLNPWHVETRLRMGRAYMELRQYKEAEQVMAPVARYAPNAPEIYEFLGASRYILKDYEGALDAYRQGRAAGANAKIMLENQAACLGNLNRFAEAILALEEALKVNPRSAAAAVAMAVTHWRMGDRAGARQWARQALQWQPDNADAKRILSLVK